MKKIKKILSGVIVGVLVFPTIAMGGSITSSLIQGKSVPEALQVLAEQIDSLTSRVEILETKQSEFESQQSKTELWQEKENACNKARDFVSENMPTGYDWWLITISHTEGSVEGAKNILEIQSNLPECQKCSAEDENCKNLIAQQQHYAQCLISGVESDEDCESLISKQPDYGGCVTIESKESTKQSLEKNQSKLERLLSVKEQYLSLKQECDDLTVQFLEKY